jgi:ABC-type antimicrobial peptide transport system permease subunit
MAYAIRSSRVGTPGFLDEVRRTIWAVNPNLPLARVETLEEIVADSTARTSFTLVMLAIAAATALLLGGIGIYGVTSYAVAQRRREIGVRMALGARRRDVGGLVLRHGLALAGIGVAAGLAAAVGLTRLMSALLYGVGAVDPATYALGGAGAVALALLASWFPARRAAAVDPLETLR